MTDEQILTEMGGLEPWAKNCHMASLSLVKSDIAPDHARVARGWCKGIVCQHSWVALGDPYDPATEVIDLTRWSWLGEDPYIYRGHPVPDTYTPHGYGEIWDVGRPVSNGGEPIHLSGLLTEARDFLDFVDPDGLDVQAWHALLNSPIGGWPAREIIDRAYRHHQLMPLIPIDVAGMLTDVNPAGVYLRGPEL